MTITARGFFFDVLNMFVDFLLTLPQLPFVMAICAVCAVLGCIRLAFYLFNA